MGTGELNRVVLENEVYYKYLDILRIETELSSGGLKGFDKLSLFLCEAANYKVLTATFETLRAETLIGYTTRVCNTGLKRLIWER